jgi:hypothetical protein
MSRTVAFVLYLTNSLGLPVVDKAGGAVIIHSLNKGLPMTPLSVSRNHLIPESARL